MDVVKGRRLGLYHPRGSCKHNTNDRDLCQPWILSSTSMLGLPYPKPLVCLLLVVWIAPAGAELTGSDVDDRGRAGFLSSRGSPSGISSKSCNTSVRCLPSDNPPDAHPDSPWSRVWGQASAFRHRQMRSVFADIAVASS